MKEKDKKIEYRPEVAKKLRISMEEMIRFYKANQRVVLYNVLSSYFEHSGDGEKAKLLGDAANLLKKDDMFAEEHFHERYRDKLASIRVFGVENLGTVSEASAFRILAPMYKQFTQSMKDGVNTSKFSKYEKFMMDSFFARIEAPLRNPNIQIHEGSSCCWYDRPGNYGEFRKDLDNTIEFIGKNSLSMEISLWEEPDEPEECVELQ